MRYIYLSVIVLLIIGVLLFAGSFIYLDMSNHQTFHYIIQSSDKDIGTIKVDRFLTEDKIIYKSVTSLPFEPLYTEQRSRLVLDKDYNLESYTKDRVSGKTVDSIYLENFRSLISFISRYQSRFSFTENIPVKRNTFIFEEDSPLTYLPIIENYNFSKGRSQGFSTISFLRQWNLPPMSRFIILTSINDEKVKIDKRKIWTENLILKIRDFPQSAIWVGKSDRSVMKLSLPSRNITIIRTFKQKKLKAVAFKREQSGFSVKDVLFKSRGVDLAGTLTFPAMEGRYPAVLLSPAPGPHDRDYQGLFVGISEYLSKNGYVCLRFDKRGVGFSGGDYASSTESGDIEDLASGVQYLTAQNMVDPDKIFLIGQGRGSINAMKLAAKNGKIKGVIMLSPTLYPYTNIIAKIDEIDAKARKIKWSDDYFNLVLKADRDSKAKVAGSDGDWAYLLGKKCFLGSMREELPNGPLAQPCDLQIPVLVMQGKETDETYGDVAVSIDKMLGVSGKERHSLTYYAYLGSLFGRKVSDGIHRAYYDTDRDVLVNIRNWLSDTLATKPVITDEGQKKEGTI